MVLNKLIVFYDISISLFKNIVSKSNEVKTQKSIHTKNFQIRIIISLKIKKIKRELFFNRFICVLKHYKYTQKYCNEKN